MKIALIERLFLFPICFYLIWRVSEIFFNGGYFGNRAEFFNGGMYSVSLLDMIINEVIVPFAIVYFLLSNSKQRGLLFLLLILVSAAFFNRVGIFLLMCYLIVADSYQLKTKFFIFMLLIVGMLLMLSIRGVSIFDESIILFFKDYMLVGWYRLIEDPSRIQIDDNNYLTPLLLLLKPLDSFVYLLNYAGILEIVSSAQVTSVQLNKFVYLPSLGNHYNAFGTILYPYVYILGFGFGLIVFFILNIFSFILLRAAFGVDKSTRVFLFLFISGVILSWSSPFFYSFVYIFIFFKLVRNVEIKSS